METKKKVVLAVIGLEFAILVAVGIWAYHRNRVVGNFPAAADAPARPSPVSPFGNQPFSADVKITGKLATFHGRMYAGHDALRMDVEMGRGAVASVITRYDKGIDWILMPHRHYIQVPIRRHSDLLSAMHDPRAKVREKDLGPETVGSYACEKYEVQVTSRGHSYSGWIWVAKEKRLDRFIVKAQDARSKESISLSHIHLVEPPADIFELPAGYHELKSSAKAR